MRLAIIGSRNLNIKIDEYISKDVSEIISGGAKGIDEEARSYAIRKQIKVTEFLPNYQLYGKYAPLKRNADIVEYADEGIAFWDGKSRGTEYTINLFKKQGKKITVYILN